MSKRNPCIHEKKACSFIESDCNPEKEKHCDEAQRREGLKFELCPITLDGKISSARTLKCEMPLFKSITHAGIPCGDFNECFLRKVPEVEEFITGSQKDERINKLTEEELYVIRDAIIRVLGFSSREIRSISQFLSASV